MEDTLDKLDFAHMLVDSIGDKKGSDIILMDMRDQAVFTDYFIMCNGDNRRQIRAIANAVRDDAKQKAGQIPMSDEGNSESGWILLDYGDLMVHVFSPEKRSYYNLEELWSNGQIVLRIQ